MDIVKVAFDDPSSAPISGSGAVLLALLVFGATVQALNYPGPSLMCVPDQRIVDMLAACRNKWGMVGNVSDRIYRECLALLRPRLSFQHVPASRRMHLDPLVSMEEEGIRLASLLGKGGLC